MMIKTLQHVFVDLGYFSETECPKCYGQGTRDEYSLCPHHRAALDRLIELAEERYPDASIHVARRYLWSDEVRMRNLADDEWDEAADDLYDACWE